MTSSVGTTSVYLEMLGKVVRAGETFVTRVTLIRLDTRVRPPVTHSDIGSLDST
jgi:hypothetical protein